jgi:O-antigen/teichoic acid export membrane protein
MARIARAFAFASMERYLALVINLGATAILSRILTPAEFGVVVIGFAAAAIADGVRELSASSYVVQAQTLTKDSLRTVFTVNTGLTLVIALAFYVLATPLSHFYQLPHIDDFFHVYALGFALGPIASPITALLTREMQFGRRAFGIVAVALINAGASIVLALQGWSSMSFAWAYVISNAASSLIYPFLHRDWSFFGFNLSSWREVLKFGLFGGATRLLYLANDNLTYLIMGRFIGPAQIALLFRGGMVATFPDRILLGGAGTVALPAFSEQARKGEQLGPLYVRALEIITAAYWPALVCIGALAYPIIAVFLGSQWSESAIYAQIFVGALFFNAPTTLNYPIQVASGGIRHTTSLALFQVVVSLAVMVLAAPYGPLAVAWSLWISVPINVAASIWLVSRIAPFSFADLARGLMRSAAVAIGTAIGPLLVLTIAGTPNIGLASAAISLVLAGLGWLAALRLVNHPLLAEGLVYLNRLRARFRPG